MAFTTLGDLRTGRLNPALGLADDSDTAFGETDARNAALIDGITRLWPEMARLVREDLTFVTNGTEYELTTVVAVETIDVISGVTSQRASEVSGLRFYTDESDDTNVPVTRLILGNAQYTGNTARVIGYAPYALPVSDDDEVDIPDRLLYVPVLGAVSYLYSAQMARHITSQRRASENNATSESTSELMAMYQMAEEKFLRARKENQATFHPSRTATPLRSR